MLRHGKAANVVCLDEWSRVREGSESGWNMITSKILYMRQHRLT